MDMKLCITHLFGLVGVPCLITVSGSHRTGHLAEPLLLTSHGGP